MTPEQREGIRQRAVQHQQKRDAGNRLAAQADEAVTRLADGIVTRAVNTRGATTPSWAEARGRAVAALDAALGGMSGEQPDLRAAERIAEEALIRETREGHEKATGEPMQGNHEEHEGHESTPVEDSENGDTKATQEATE